MYSIEGDHILVIAGAHQHRKPHQSSCEERSTFKSDILDTNGAILFLFSPFGRFHPIQAPPHCDFKPSMIFTYILNWYQAESDGPDMELFLMLPY